MIGRVVAHELRTASRDGRVRGLLVLLLAVLAIAVLVGVARSRTLRSEHAAATAIERGNWLAQGEKNPHSAAHYGQFAFKPPSALALFDRGVDSYLGVAVWLEAHRRNSLVHRPADDAPVVQRFGELSAANVLQVLGPLLALLLTFAAVAGERQRGTLRQLLAQGASPATLVLGKLAGGDAGCSPRCCSSRCSPRSPWAVPRRGSPCWRWPTLSTSAASSGWGRRSPPARATRARPWCPRWPCGSRP
jgi:ABC-2 type transport system permease protein